MPSAGTPSRRQVQQIAQRPPEGVRSIVDMALKVDPKRPRTSAGRRKPPSIREKLQRSTSNCPVRVPRRDWELVVCGTKRMFRTYSNDGVNRSAPTFRWPEEFPRPAVIYSTRTETGRWDGGFDTRLAVILAWRQEPLGAISPRDLQLEGFDSIKQFRSYWRGRYPKFGWRDRDLINVVELRLWTPEDDREQADWLLRRLFGEHLE